MKSIRIKVAGTLLGGGVLLASAAGMSTAAAQTPQGEYVRGPGRLYSKLGLTAEQQASVRAIFEAGKPRMKALHQQMQANHLKLSQTSPDDPDYATVVAEVAASNAALASQRTTQAEQVRAQIHALLTPAQKTQLSALEAQRAAEPHREHWGHRPPPPPEG